MTVTCEACESRLLELAYDEIDDEDGAALRAHLSACSTCLEAYERLGSARRLLRGLRLGAPPALDRALELARARTSRGQDAHRPDAPAASAIDPTSRDRRPDRRRWLERLGTPAMASQLALLVVLLLVTSIGLWHLPHRDDEARPIGPEVDPDPATLRDESVLAPAEPLRLAHDPRTGRVIEESRASLARPTAPAPAREQARPRATPEDTIALTDEPTMALEAAAARPLHDEGEAERPPPPTATRDEPSDEAIDEPSGDDAAAWLDAARRLAAAGRCAESRARYEALLTRFPSHPDRAALHAESLGCAGPHVEPGPPSGGDAPGPTPPGGRVGAREPPTQPPHR